MLDLNSENTNTFNSPLVNATEILKEVKESYSALSDKDFGSYDDFNNENDINNSSENSVNTSNILEKSEDVENKEFPETNCLALTVRKDYNLTIIKNVFSVGGSMAWKIALITGIINILNILF